MACGIALKRPRELDSYMSPDGAKRPRTTTSHCSPFRPAFSTASSVSSSTVTQSPPVGSSLAVPSGAFSSPFHNVTTRLSSEQLESYLRAEIRYLRRRKLIPKRNVGRLSDGDQSNVFRVPGSPNSSDSDGESQYSHRLDKERSSVGSSESHIALSDKPQFTFKQVQMICERLLKEQEARLRSDYESVLNAKLSEQYDTFVKFTQDQIHRQIDSGTASLNSDSEFDNYEKAYVDAVLVAYKLLQFISFSLTKIGSGKGEGILWLLKEMFYYSFYWPYSIVLIVSYESFKSQLRERRTKRPSIAEIAVEGSRFVFWTVTTDFLRHFFYVTAFMNQPVLLEVLPLAVLCSVGYIAGQLFQLKYMAVFGLPRFFARLDCMQPPGLPICISRVSLYSRMWRYFDRGLYGFMKENIFVPVAAPSYSFIKRVSATTLSFGFVFLWHGASPAFLCWVSLNLVEIFAENAAKELAKLPRISSLISRYRPSTIRRVKAFLQIPCTSLGILAIFFFLGDNDGETGWVFIERIVLGEFLHFKFPLLCLIVLGYCYAQCCMEFEKMLT